MKKNHFRQSGRKAFDVIRAYDRTALIIICTGVLFALMGIFQLILVLLTPSSQTADHYFLITADIIIAVGCVGYAVFRQGGRRKDSPAGVSAESDMEDENAGKTGAEKTQMKKNSRSAHKSPSASSQTERRQNSGDNVPQERRRNSGDNVPQERRQTRFNNRHPDNQ
jgi:hypothetical protein